MSRSEIRTRLCADCLDEYSDSACPTCQPKDYHVLVWEIPADSEARKETP